MKKSIRTLLALALSAQMIFSLTACGSKKKDNNEISPSASVNSDTGVVSTSSGDSRIVSENDPYFTVTTSALKASFSKDKEVQMSDIVSHYIVGDRILADVFVSYKMPDEVLKRELELDLEDEKQMEEYMKIEEEYESSSLQLFDLNGEALGEIKLDSDVTFTGAFPGQNGEILIVCTKFSPRECRSVPVVSVYSSSGEKIRDVDLQIKDPLEDVRLYVLENGNMLVASIGKFWILDSNGKVLSEESNPDLNGMVLHSGGKWFAVMPKYTSDGGEVYVSEIDTSKGKLAGSPFKCSDSVLSARQGEQDCFILNANGIEKFDIATQTKTQVLAWKDTDINSGTLRLSGARIASENDMVFFQVDARFEAGRGAMDMKSQGAELLSIVHLSKAEKNPHAGKTRLKLGINGNVTSTFLEEVLTYNKDPKNSTRIEIIDYTAGADEALDQEEVDNSLLKSTEQLIMDMLAGNGPDILVGYSELSQFNTDTMLVDLNPLINADSTINHDELYDNIIHSFEANGKLYTIPLTYTLEGMAVNTSFQGAKEKWTFAEFEQMASTLPADVQALSSDGASELLKLWMPSLSSHFIDDQNKTVNFESEEFRTLLEIVKKYGSNGNPNLGKSQQRIDNINELILGEGNRFEENMLASVYTSIADLQIYASLSREKKDHTIAFTGVPSLSGMGMTAKGHLSMAITASCKDPDLAWQFIRSFLNEDAQQELSFNTDTLPVNRNAYKKNCQIEIEVNKENLERLKKNEGHVNPDIVKNAVELTKEHVDALDALISSITESQSWDNDVMNIILEESAGFFAGQRSVEDVVKLIQNRATLVVQER